MALPPAQTPLYNHTLPALEQWLKSLGGHQDPQALHCWSLQYATWKAQISLDIEEFVITYETLEQPPITRSFKYSLSREDIEAAVLAGP